MFRQLLRRVLGQSEEKALFLGIVCALALAVGIAQATMQDKAEMYGYSGVAYALLLYAPGAAIVLIVDIFRARSKKGTD